MGGSRRKAASPSPKPYTLNHNPKPAVPAGCREAAEAWEAAFLRLAHHKLSRMVSDAGLRLSFSAERSVADELARESTADGGTVAWSYASMLVRCCCYWITTHRVSLNLQLWARLIGI